MRSTGEVLGIADNVGEAFLKSQEATGVAIPLKGVVIMSVNDKDKNALLPVAKKFEKLGFSLLATGGTHKFLADNNIKVGKINKLYEDRPNIADYIINQEVNILINTPAGKTSVYDDSEIRKGAIRKKVFYITTIAAAEAAVSGIEEMRNRQSGVKSIQEFHENIS
jgi:carbamoyl-phosphate synthase large subunit